MLFGCVFWRQVIKSEKEKPAKRAVLPQLGTLWRPMNSSSLGSVR